MKSYLHLFLMLFGATINAQNALYNSGNIQVHSNGQIGFHTNFINDTSFDQSEGLAGFYGNSQIAISGSIPPEFWDVELMNTAGLFLQNQVNVQNNTNFIDGDVVSPLNDSNVYLNFMDSGFFNGEQNAAKVTGFAAINNRDFFSFPVGDAAQLRPLIMNSQGSTALAVCAYLFENPYNPLSLGTSFNTTTKIPEIGTVNDKEFWIFESEIPASVTISWNQRSDLASIPNATFESIIVVGWSKTTNRWEIIGNEAQGGDINDGFITSTIFNPMEFSAITFGTVPLPTDTFAVNNPTLGNYFLSPNGDGTNDFLVIDNMNESPNNSLRIFNRFGQKVYEKINYVDEFNGLSNTGKFYLSQDIGLPEGIYYYFVTLDDLELEYTGFLFLDR
ncbi:gliding motility-associated C-terminal domain-containing protein [Muricauda sp. 2012CJ35-5]|uniref:Gliding motility-associated C-terminal domain-containing protein n=1 Tax=Flagellimonas spongiicola TaxID=2942208 RepID=A0ABT0PV59_9FLAO|nr:gliding motility-associated C-terminal domain-containing protein [Allomuricauda spongiicola]MCL6275176.1 gliding motility-associated C-terminal domain-containing protein [Allomuricauda spongiicola]